MKYPIRKHDYLDDSPRGMPNIRYAIIIWKAIGWEENGENPWCVWMFYRDYKTKEKRDTIYNNIHNQRITQKDLDDDPEILGIVHDDPPTFMDKEIEVFD